MSKISTYPENRGWPVFRKVSSEKSFREGQLLSIASAPLGSPVLSSKLAILLYELPILSLSCIKRMLIDCWRYSRAFSCSPSSVYARPMLTWLAARKGSLSGSIDVRSLYASLKDSRASVGRQMSRLIKPRRSIALAYGREPFSSNFLSAISTYDSAML